MLDISLYRQNEGLAKNELSKWQTRSRHSLEAFEKIGFPVRVDNISQLRALLDTMSENRYTPFLEAMGGFTKEEHDFFVDTCVDSIKFNNFLFPNKKPILALNNLMQGMLFYVLINRLGNYTSLLELGCGSGFISFFMAKKKDLTLYTQTEVCESFYLLQSHIGKFLFGDSFYESALDGGYGVSNLWTSSGFGADAEDTTEINIFENKKKRASHYPWWKLGELASNDDKFDIVASNANLLEFSRSALLDYLPLIQKKLKEDGLFVFHCSGSPFNGTIETLFKDLYEHEFAPLFFISEFGLKGMLQFSEKRVVVAPAGYATGYLLENPDFTNRFDEILLLDDSKAGGYLKGRKIISRAELMQSGIKEGVIYHDNKHTVNIFRNAFDKAGVKIVDVTLSNIGRSFGVFVGKKHHLFDKYHDMKNFKIYFNSNENFIKSIFDFSDKNGRFYNKQEIIDAILSKIDSSSNA